MRGKKEFGDYQTPIEFADKVCLYLKNEKKIHPTVVIEPTCGIGNFLQSSLVFNASKYLGIEINPDYCTQCNERFKNKNVEIVNSDFFRFSCRSACDNDSNVLVIGNPPWATNGMLSSLCSDNIPAKSNFKGLKGIDAITGASNFDICEYMILKIVREFQNTESTIAMLCKTGVARNIFAELVRTKTCFASCDLLEFDAKSIFGVSASACVLIIQMTSKHTNPNQCSISSFANPSVCKGKLKYLNGQIVNDKTSADYSGKCCFEWRQGIKHDCASVMELSYEDGVLINRLGENVNIENQLIYPLIKSSMFKNSIIHDFSKRVIITQRKPRENTSHLAFDAPKTWEYLNRHKELFAVRKSSIYTDAPDFSIFGVGEYSFSQYKVGLSGFYKKPLFCLLYSDDKKPVMLDDTSYFIGFDEYDLAYVAMLILNSEKVQRFITESAFLDSKRPFTKKLLGNISFKKITDDLSLSQVRETEDKLGIKKTVSATMYDNFISFMDYGQTYLPLEYLFG